MKPSKVYIISHDEAISREYAKTASDSCDKLGMPWEISEGFSNMNPNDAWNSERVGLKKRIERRNRSDKAQLCSASHAAVWRRIYDQKECAVIFEHDSILLHKPDIEIPDIGIVVLGYKVTDPHNYDHENAGAPKEVKIIEGHEGAHAYAITWKTAEQLLDGIEKKGVATAVDNAYFLNSRRSHTDVPIFIMNPTPAIGWLRKSTIWASSANKNYKFLKSFSANYQKN